MIIVALSTGSSSTSSDLLYLLNVALKITTIFHVYTATGPTVVVMKLWPPAPIALAEEIYRSQGRGAYYYVPSPVHWRYSSRVELRKRQYEGVRWWILSGCYLRVNRVLWPPRQELLRLVVYPSGMDGHSIEYRLAARP
jgi:hypothetical protein